jgi:oxygen-independent coproporphyrinogen-3 oxidase
VASFGHLNRVHYQNHHDFQPYVDAVSAGQFPTHRAYVLPEDERYLREFMLQLKLGHVRTDAFTEKFGEDPRTRFAAPLATLKAWGFLVESSTHLGLTRDGLLQVDRLLQEFFKPEHRTGRYA